MSKFRKSARGEACSVRIPGVCNFNSETTVLAHLPCVDKGMGHKGPDWWSCYACSACHDAIDRRNPLGHILIDQRPEYLLGAIYETQKRMIAKGLIKIL